MKATFALIVLAGVVLSGCESDIPPSREAAHKFERGITGRGTVYQPDRSNDPVIREQSRVGY